MRVIFAADGAAGMGEVLGDPAPGGRRVSAADPPDPAADRLVDSLARLYAYPAAVREHGRPWVRANMVSSADGAATAAGKSAGLSGSADRLLFGVLRSLADVIVVGASTARVERYRPPDPAAIWPRLRDHRPPLPPIAIVTRRLALDFASPLFNPPQDRPSPIVITTAAAPPDRLELASTRADVIIAGDHDVDLSAALAALSDRGHTKILTEGGPTLLAQLAAAGLLNELCLTISPVLEGGYSPRILNPPAPAPVPDQVSTLCLLSVLEHDGALLCRYQVT